MIITNLLTNETEAERLHKSETWSKLKLYVWGLGSTSNLSIKKNETRFLIRMVKYAVKENSTFMDPSLKKSYSHSLRYVPIWKICFIKKLKFF